MVFSCLVMATPSLSRLSSSSLAARCKKTVLFYECFPYVRFCPEPVLAK